MQMRGPSHPTPGNLQCFYSVRGLPVRYVVEFGVLRSAKKPNMLHIDHCKKWSTFCVVIRAVVTHKQTVIFMTLSV